MKILKVVLLTLTFCLLSYGQAKYFAVKNYKVQPDLYRRDYSEGKAFTSNLGKSGTVDFSFPIFSKQTNNYAVDKINQTLQISELEILQGFETKSIFEIVSFDGGGIYGGKTSIESKVYENNSKVLSVKLDQSSCGATCTYWVKYYNFNSGNGDLIQLKDLFTEKGFEKFFAFVTKRRIAQLKNEIRKKLPHEERGDFEGISGSYEQDDLTDFFIKNNSLYIDGENSFSKHQKFSGIETVSRFRLSEFKSYLNDYGKSLFGLSKSPVKKYRSNILPQLFQGKIGNQKIVLFLNKNSENEVRAGYVYSKYGRGIFLEGKINDNELTLTEKLPETDDSGLVRYVDNGYVEASFDGETILGTWTNRDRTKTHELKLVKK